MVHSMDRPVYPWNRPWFIHGLEHGLSTEYKMDYPRNRPWFIHGIDQGSSIY